MSCFRTSVAAHSIHGNSVCVSGLAHLYALFGLPTPPGKAYTLLTGHLITGKPLRSEPAQEKWFQVKPSKRMSFWFTWVLIFSAHFVCHDILMLGTSPIKWRQRPDTTIAVDLDVKHHFKQNKSVPA